MVKAYTDKQLLEKVKSLSNYIYIPSKYWILAVRSSADLPDEFDDKIYLFKGERFITVASCTTHSGTYGLLNFRKWNRKGAFVAKSDFWHYFLWKKGTHKGKMDALVQAKDIVGYRDNDKDLKSEEIGEEVKGLFGINFHKVSYDNLVNFVRKYNGRWSVGCVVVNDVEKYYEIMSYFDLQPRVTMCIINEF